MQNKVVVYYNQQCSHCQEQVQWFKQKEVLFKKKNVNNPEFAKEFKNRKGKGYPLTVISLATGAEIEILGFDKKLLSKYLN